MRLTVFATDSGPLATAGVVGVPGAVVVAVVALGYAVPLLVAVWPRERQATGEMYDRDKEGDWKP